MTEERGVSEFNGAVSYLNRLNACFYQADEAAINLDAPAWFHTLMALERELSTEMKKQEQEIFSQERTRINILVARNSKIIAKNGRTEILPELYEALHQYELNLRKILKEAGLQNKMMQGAEQFFK